ncbi:MAG: NADPH:quinone reductase-like Zn-dependent oxidoreductase [Saprospiraceae bacterium]|jgi:NADPH:quinone reductase-like Zn-dependent oxidoreductase
MKTRRIYKLKAGSIARLKISEEKLDQPTTQEVQIKIHTIGLNFADVFAILGLYSATPTGEFIPGLEYAGEITAVGDGVTNFKVGDKVMGVSRFGAYATHINIEYRYTVPLPEDWSYEEGAGYLVQVLTAYYGLDCLGALKKDHTVLIHSGAGGVGIWANRICKSIGAYTIGTVGSTSKLGLLKSEGYDAGILRNSKTFEKELTEKLNDRPLDLIMECIGGKIMKIGFDQLGPMGRQVVYGSAQYGTPGDRPNYFKLIPKYLMRPKIDPQNMIKFNRGILAFNLIYLFDNVEIMQSLLQELKTLDLGKPIVGHTFKFEEMPEAIRLFQSGSTVGKVVIKIE